MKPAKPQAQHDAKPSYHTITQADGTIKTYRRNPKNDPNLEQEIMRRLQQQEDNLRVE
jgi:hypothetical protein